MKVYIEARLCSLQLENSAANTQRQAPFACPVTKAIPVGCWGDLLALGRDWGRPQCSPLSPGRPRQRSQHHKPHRHRQGRESTPHVLQTLLGAASYGGQ